MDATERTPSPAARAALTAVGERLRQIAEGAAAPEDALEPALRTVAEGVGAAAGALCLFDQRDERLRLAAEMGLSDEGCRRLRNVRRGDVAGWDMPLSGLLSRRVYLIESASRNRYVPPLVEQADAVRTVACLPICAGTTPLGSLLLVTLKQSITEQTVQALQPALRELATLIEATRERGGTRAPARAAAKPGPAPGGDDAERLHAAPADIDDLQRALETARAADEARAAAMAQAESARTALETLKAELVRARGETERCEGVARAALAERDTIVRALEDALAALAAARADLDRSREEIERLRAAAPPAPAEADAGAERPAASPGPGPPMRPWQPNDTAAGGRRVAVLDADPAWERIALDGHEVAALTPGDDLADRLREMAPGHIIVNLATPRALGALAALRAAGCTARFWGCLASPAADRALPLGLIEPAVRPLDPDAILAALRPYGRRGSCVLTAGADVEALISLRHALVREQMSVSIAWDAKQAEDLLAMIKPGIAVIDLELPPRKGYGLVARLAGLDPLPTLMLIPGDDDGAAGFEAALAAGLRARSAVSLKGVLAGLVARGEA